MGGDICVNMTLQKLSEEHLAGVLEELTEVREQLHKETEDKEQIQTALEALQVIIEPNMHVFCC